jgi:hypothetical protein
MLKYCHLKYMTKILDTAVLVSLFFKYYYFKYVS